MSAPNKRELPAAKMPKGKKIWKDTKGGAQGTRFADRQLMGVNPNDEQFEPTEASPINGHKRMAGID